MRRFIFVLGLLVSARTGAAQLATSYEIGLPGARPEQWSVDALLVGIRIASIKPLVPSVDCEVLVLPALLARGVAVLGLGVDVTYPLPIGRSVILSPRGGASALVAAALMAEGGFAAEMGYNVGSGVVWRTDPKTAVRADIGRHWFDEYAITVVTIGVVTVP